MMGSEKNPHRNGATTVDLPLSAEMAEQLRRLHKAVRSGYGQIEITINPRGVRIVDLAEYRFGWSG